MGETLTMHFAIEGEFITNMAREKLYADKDLGAAIRILRSSLESDQLDSDEQLMICLQVLHGCASITGRSDTPDYGLTFRDDIDERPTDLSAISQFITDIAEENRKLREMNQQLAEKMAFITDNLEDYQIRRLNADYYNTTGEPMFRDIDIPMWMKETNQYISRSGTDTLVESYLAQRRREAEMEEGECDYGWLEPDGTWHPVEWGKHSGWAMKWLNEHMPFKSNPEIYWRTDEDGKRHHIANGDVLVYSLGWILMDSPHQGLAKPTVNPHKEMTKAQREFLYDYFIERERKEEANALYKD